MRRLVPALLALPMLVGCAERLDTERAEREIAAGYTAQTPGADVRSVACPSDVSADIGTTATCTLTLASGARLAVSIRVIGDGGRIRWAVAPAEDPGRTP